MKENVLIITDSYPPEVRSASHLMKDLADGLKENGHQVYVATSFPQYNLAEEGRTSSLPKYAVEDGINVLRIKTLPHHRANFVIRGIAQLTMPYIFFQAIKKNIKEKIDVVILHSPPLPLTISAYKTKKFYQAKYILNLHDFFPQNAVDLGILKNKPIIKFFESMERKAYRNADLIVTPSGEHKNFLQKNRGVAGEKIFVIPHWIDTKPFEKAKRTGKFRKLYGLEDKLIFLFAGVFGPSQGLDLIIRVAQKLKDNKEICFLFVGDGSDKNRLLDLVKSYDLQNVIFKPFVSKEDYPELAKDSDVGVISLSAKNTTPAVPAKLLGYLAAALPVIAFVHKESDIHRIVREANCGFTAISDDDDKALAAVLKIYQEKNKLRQYGENGFRHVLNNFTRKICVEKFEKLF
jgi:glycosyltransferase involved in cell wall biosynthesis